MTNFYRGFWDIFVVEVGSAGLNIYGLNPMIFSPPQLTSTRCYTKIRYLLVLLRSHMSKNTSITLGDHFDGFVTYQIKSGRYGSVSEVVRAGLRALKIMKARYWPYAKC